LIYINDKSIIKADNINSFLKLLFLNILISIQTYDVFLSFFKIQIPDMIRLDNFVLFMHMHERIQL